MPAAMSPLTVYAPLTRVYCPDTPFPIVMAHIRLAVSEFCMNTRLWRETVTQNVSGNPHDITTADGVEIHQIERCEFDGRRLAPVMDHDVEPNDRTTFGTPRCFSQTRPDQIAVYPFTGGTYSLTLILKLSAVGAEGVANEGPTFIAQHYAEAISRGAAARILMIPGQPWSDGAAAQMHRIEFDRLTAGAAQTATVGQQGAALRTKPMWM